MKWRSGRGAVLVLVMLVVSIGTTGCLAGEDYKDYMSAVEKTNTMTQGASKIEIELENTFNASFLESLSDEDRDEIDKMDHLQASVVSRFNNNQNQGIYEAYVFTGKLGMDFKVYRKSNEAIFLKMPFSASLYAVDTTKNSESDLENPVASQDYFKSIGRDWNLLLKEDNIFAGEKTVITNGDGEVKATKFSIKPTTEQLSLFLSDLRASLIENKEMMTAYIKTMNPNAEMSEADYEKMVNVILNAMKIEKYEEVAFVDLDGYIIEENVNIVISFNPTEEGEIALSKQKISYKKKYWDIEKEQQLSFKELDNYEILPIENLEDWSVEK